MLDKIVILISFTGFVLLLLWKSLRAFVFKSPLDIIPGPSSASLVKGNLEQVFTRDAWSFLDHLTNDYQSVVKIHGIFGKRVLWVFDPKALQHVVLKDQAVYEEVEFALALSRVLFGPGISSSVGEQHHRQRKLLNPVFSIAHLRNLTPIFYETSHRLREGVVNQLKNSGTDEVDILAWTGRTALELIGKGGFGHSFDPLVSHDVNPYAEAVKAFVPTFGRCLSYRLLGPIYEPIILLAGRYPTFRSILRSMLPLFPVQAVHDMKRIVTTLDDSSRAICSEKKEALLAGELDAKLNVHEGRNLLSVLLRANMEASGNDRLPEDEIIAQLSTLTFAGTDTTSNALARVLHLLCIHPEVQQRLREEVVNAQNDGQDIPYDELVSLPYLDAICRETLRLYPPLPQITRETTRDSILPLASPLTCTDGSVVSSIPVPKGTTVLIGVYSSNRNKAIWGLDADEWKPERWLGDGVPTKVTEARIPGVYSNLMTFLGGGRACIGFKFSQLEMKVVLSVLITTFRFSFPSDGIDEVKWNSGTIVYPSSKTGDLEKPSLKLKLSIV